MVPEFYLNKTIMKPADHSPLYVPSDSYLTHFPSCRALFPGSAPSAATLPLATLQVWKQQPEPLSLPPHRRQLLVSRIVWEPSAPSLLSPPVLSCRCVQQTTKGNSQSSSFQFWVSLEGLAQTQQKTQGSG